MFEFKEIINCTENPTRDSGHQNEVKQGLASQNTNIPFASFLLCPLFFLPTLHCLPTYSLLLCPNSFLCLWFLNLNPSHINTQKMSWLRNNDCCHCFCLSFIMLHLVSVSCIQTAHSLGSDVNSYLLEQYEATWGSRSKTWFLFYINTSFHLCDPYSLGTINLESKHGFHAVFSQLTFRLNKVLIYN